MTPEEVFEKWWKSYVLDPEEGYEGYEKEDHMQQAFLAGIQYQEMNQINCLYEIRKAVGDPEGKLMQSELVERVKRIVTQLEKERAFVKKLDGIIEEVGGVTASCLNPYEDLKNALQAQKDKAERYWRENFSLREDVKHLEKEIQKMKELLKSVTTEKEEA
jgi:chromosome segregation ATPase